MPVNYETFEDPELIKLFINGNETAFETLYFRYRKNLYGFLNNMISDQCMADEVFEDTWLKVIDNIDKYRDDGKFSAWLFKVARNIFYDKCRRKKTMSEVELDEAILDETMTSKYPEPDRNMNADELGKYIAQGINELPTEQKEVFLLRQQDFSFKEISEMQNCSVNTALSRMQYALKSLKSFLNSIDNGEFTKH